MKTSVMMVGGLASLVPRACLYYRLQIGSVRKGYELAFYFGRDGIKALPE